MIIIIPTRLTRIIRIWVAFTAWRKARSTDAVLQKVETKSAKTGKDCFEAQGGDGHHDHDHKYDQLHQDLDGDHLTHFPVGAEAVWISSQGVAVASVQVLDLNCECHHQYHHRHYHQHNQSSAQKLHLEGRHLQLTQR